LAWWVEQRRIDRTELYAADEIFFTGTGVQVSPVTSVDHRSVGTGNPGPFCMKLQSTTLPHAVVKTENTRIG